MTKASKKTRRARRTFAPETRREIVAYAAEHGGAKAVKKFKVGWQSIVRWREQYPDAARKPPADGKAGFERRPLDTPNPAVAATKHAHGNGLANGAANGAAPAHGNGVAPLESPRWHVLMPGLAEAITAELPGLVAELLPAAVDRALSRFFGVAMPGKPASSSTEPPAPAPTA